VVPAHTQETDFSHSESIINRVRREEITHIWQCKENATSTPRKESE
jgi:hypothetical protein